MLIAGVDEVGRGPLAGPVVAAAVILHPHQSIDGLADSKKLSPKRRAALYDIIHERALAVAIAQATVAEIDQLNILHAALLAMQRAVNQLTILPDWVQVDGNRMPDIAIGGEAIVKGDDKIEAIMAASIVAKVWRDRLMQELDTQYPGYGLAQHAGYPTKLHLQALQELGVTPIHRQTFTPVARLLESRLRVANELD